jgi:pimeloyl-ACP methyl ester carboxylesterase
VVKNRISVALIYILICSAVLTSCAEQAEPPGLTPTKRPPPTLTVRMALEDMHFVVEYDGQLVATEDVSAQQVDQGLLVTSELHRVGFVNSLEKRSLLLSPNLDPITYDLEIGTPRAHSAWVALQGNNMFSVLSNNLAWYGPVLVENIQPMAQLMLDSTPSALPFVILALRLTGITDTTTSLDSQYHYLDVLDDLPTSQPITCTQSIALKGLVIGTVPYEATTQNGAFCTLWLRPADRSLYSVEFDTFRFNHWLVRTDPSLAGVKRVTIRRVTSLPALPQAAALDTLRRLPLEFKGSDGGIRRGILVLPDGPGPFPCLVLQGGGGITNRWDPGSIAAKHGWAVFSYDKQGLGASDGVYERDTLQDMAKEALSAAAMLRQRPELIPNKLTYLGVGEGALVGALASATAVGFDRYILVGNSLSMPFPDTVSFEINSALAKVDGWNQSQVLTFTNLSIVYWQNLIAINQTNVVLAGRGASLASLKQLMALDPRQSLAQSSNPILVVVGETDPWVSLTQAIALVAQLNQAGKTTIELKSIPGWDGALSVAGESLINTSADKVIWDWLAGWTG